MNTHSASLKWDSFFSRKERQRELSVHPKINYFIDVSTWHFVLFVSCIQYLLIPTFSIRRRKKKRKKRTATSMVQSRACGWNVSQTPNTPSDHLMKRNCSKNNCNWISMQTKYHFSSNAEKGDWVRQAKLETEHEIFRRRDRWQNKKKITSALMIECENRWKTLAQNVMYWSNRDWIFHVAFRNGCYQYQYYIENYLAQRKHKHSGWVMFFSFFCHYTWLYFEEWWSIRGRRNEMQEHTSMWLVASIHHLHFLFIHFLIDISLIWDDFCTAFPFDFYTIFHCAHIHSFFFSLSSSTTLSFAFFVFFLDTLQKRWNQLLLHNSRIVPFYVYGLCHFFLTDEKK